MENLNQTDLTARQAKILAAIVKEHCDTCEPVGSGDLAHKYDFGISAPSIRNEMQILERQGYINQPHTSAGRVPTDLGFRYFVNQLMDKVKLTLQEQDRLKKELLKLQMAHMEMGRRLAKLLSENSGAASFALFPDEVSTMGISNILENSSLPNEDAREIAKFFDNIDEHAEQMISDYAGKGPEAKIGKEITLSKHSDYSMVVSGLELPSGKKGVIGVVGPKSMKYEKNMSLLEYISKLLGGGMGIILITLIQR
ncbi:MAG: hypothetical protein JNN11_01430 [Candidatus Doudnabacteria bacterium]|nr:hypothetical protein [Candidatus Doudnabacteria bacterium]